MKYYAHSVKDDIDQEKWEPLAKHLRAVADKAKELAKEAIGEDSALSRAAEAAGLLHDLGKYRKEWQRYLDDSVAKRPTSPVPHAIYGAAYAEHFLNNSLLALVIAGHHAGLNNLPGNSGLTSILEREETRHRNILGEIVPLACDQVPAFPTDELPIPFDGEDDRTFRQFEFWTRVLFSTLIDADRLETERFYTGGRPKGPRLDARLAEDLLGRLKTAKAKKAKKAKGKSDPKLLALRNRIYDKCIQAGERDRGFFELTVPTGGGKTLSGMAFALAHAKHYNHRRVIVVIPYLSIIEQNAREYRSILGSENVVEHHSAVAEQEAANSRGEPHERTFAELATENWDAPIIVTTSVQFLETLLEASPRRCRKLHNVARSVIIFDEAQALPTHILNPLVSVFRELVETFGCSIVFSTATQPAFRRGAGLTEGLGLKELKPILPPKLVAKSFRDLQRVEYRPELTTPWDWGTLVDRMTKDGDTQGLCVLNIRRHAREVWEKLREKLAEKDAVFHLSSAICAEHRMVMLGDPEKPKEGTVRYRLKHGLPCWLVSTQVIEAGVDVDFPRVFRALGPLDSIVQAAGRCNREGKQQSRGEVVVFLPEDEKGMPKGLYKIAAGEARTFLCEYTGKQLATKPAVFARYFDIIYGRADCDAHDIQSKRKDFQFREVAGLARVIEDGGTPVIVPYKAAKKRIERIRTSGAFKWRTMRRLQRYTVNLRTGDFQKLQLLGSVSRLLGDDSPWVLQDSCYDRDLGVLIRGLSPDDFLQFDIEEK